MRAVGSNQLVLSPSRIQEKGASGERGPPKQPEGNRALARKPAGRIIILTKRSLLIGKWGIRGARGGPKADINMTR